MVAHLAAAGRRLGLAAAILLPLLAAGCDDDVGKRHPVEGRVLLGGKPLQGAAGTITFVPDRSQGNDSPYEAGGTLDTAGRFTLQTKGRPGAPAGKYKVVVVATPVGLDDREVVKRPLIHSRFSTEKNTPLRAEITAEAAVGTYDLKVTRN